MLGLSYVRVIELIDRRLIELREEQHLTKTDVARVLNIPPEGYSYYEQGTRTPNIDAIRKLAGFYGVSTDYLLGETEIRASGTLSEEDETILRDIKYAFSGDYNSELTYEEKMHLVELARFAGNIKRGMPRNEVGQSLPNS